MRSSELFEILDSVEEMGALRPANWLPTPKGADYDLTFRFYGPKRDVAAGGYFPPGIVAASR